MKSITLVLVGLDLDDELPSVNPPLTPSDKKPEVEKKTAVVENFVKTETVNPGEETVEIPKSLLLALTRMAEDTKKAKTNEKTNSGKNEDVLNAIRGLTEAYRDTHPIDTRFLGQRPVEMYEIDEEDVLLKPAIFFAHCVSFTILDDKRNGRTVFTPYKRAIKFKKIHRTTSGDSRNKVYQTVSAAIISSKKEAEFLENHSLFGIQFFKSITEGSDLTAELQEKLVMAWNMISSLDDHAIVQRCSTMGISITSSDSNTMRKKLAKKIAEGMIKDENKRRAKPVENLEKFLNKEFEEVAENSNPSVTY